ncbi:MAG: hypothetical protein IJ119_09585, partial [Clostridia bacterium]|nr:hypothetical protein [Clostridia bacterium]
NLRNRPVTAHRNTCRSGGNLPPQKMAWRLIVAATEVLTLVVNAFPITTFAKLTTLPVGEGGFGEKCLHCFAEDG